MKKLLCFVLALAMVASCVSMVTFFVSAESQTTTVNGKYSYIDFEGTGDIDKVSTMSATSSVKSLATASDLAAAGVPATTPTGKTIGNAVKWDCTTLSTGARYAGGIPVAADTMKAVVDGAGWYTVSFWIYVATPTIQGDKAFCLNLRPGSTVNIVGGSATNNYPFGSASFAVKSTDWQFFEASIYITAECATAIDNNSDPKISVEKYSPGSVYYMDGIRFTKLDGTDNSLVRTYKVTQSGTKVTPSLLTETNGLLDGSKGTVSIKHYNFNAGFVNYWERYDYPIWSQIASAQANLGPHSTGSTSMNVASKWAADDGKALAIYGGETIYNATTADAEAKVTGAPVSEWLTGVDISALTWNEYGVATTCYGTEVNKGLVVKNVQPAKEITTDITLGNVWYYCNVDGLFTAKATAHDASYTFSGWYTGATAETANQLVSTDATITTYGDKVLVAKFVDPNAATPTPVPTSIVIDFENADDINKVGTMGGTLTHVTAADLTAAGIPETRGAAAKYDASAVTARYAGMKVVDTATLKAVVDGASWYRVSFQVYIDTITTNADKAFCLNIRPGANADLNNDGQVGTSENNYGFGSRGMSVADVWIVFTADIYINENTAAVIEANAGNIAVDKYNIGAVYYVDDIKFEKLDYDPTVTPSPSPTPVVTPAPTAAPTSIAVDFENAADINKVGTMGGTLTHVTAADLTAAGIPATKGGAAKYDASAITARYAGMTIVTADTLKAVVDGASWYRVSFQIYISKLTTNADKRMTVNLRPGAVADLNNDGSVGSSENNCGFGMRDMSTANQWITFTADMYLNENTVGVIEANNGNIAIDMYNIGAIYYVDDIKFEKLDYDPTQPTPTPTPVGTPTPAPTSALVDFEDAADINKVGTMGGTLTHVTAADLTAAGIPATKGGAAKYDASAVTARYAGMTIVTADTLKAVVDGASWYRVSFRIYISKLTTNADKRMTVNLRPGANADIDNDSSTAASNNCGFGMTSMHIADQWITFTADMYLNEDTVGVIEANNGSIAIDMYNIGAVYYVDDILFEKLDFDPTAPTPTPTNKPTAAPGGKDPATGTGDVLPVALIATAAMAVIGLVVVAKKKED